MPAYSQEDRLVAVETSLGPDELLLRSFTGHEEISRLFHFQLDLLSENPRIKPKDIVGQKVSVRLLQTDDETERYFHGHVVNWVALPPDRILYRYSAEVVPWLWFLTRTTDCRIFQEKTIPEIIETVFKDFGFSDFDISGIRGAHPTWEYCVQYRESAFNFVSRLMEQEGIFYFFRHEKDKHILVLADSKTVHKPCPYQSEVRLEHSEGPGYARGEDTISYWERRYGFRSGKCAMTDFNSEMPSTSLMAQIESVIPLGGIQRYEIYDYPGEYKTKAEGEQLVRLRMEEEESAYDIISGNGDCRSLSAGFTFTLSAPQHTDQEGDYLLTSVTHTADVGDYYAGMEDGLGRYQNSFTCIPADIQFRPARNTLKPLVQGLQTALVVGPPGEEIYTDKYGRVKVHFHWDRLGQRSENSSCWIRVSHPWAGKGWGAIAIPRIGQEVIVDFLEGDPDRPIITGRVYNAEQTPPYELPGQQTKSTVKSMSSKGGGGFNELRFEDKKGEEEVFLHAEKDLHIRVKHDRHETIERDRHLTVARDRFENVNRDCHMDLARDRIEKVGRDHHLEVAGKEAIKVTGSHSLKVQGDVIEEFTGNHSSQVTRNIYVKGMQVVIEASTGITLKVGGNFVTIDPSGVAINGSLILLNSGGVALSGASGNLVSPLSPTAAKEAVKALPGALAAVRVGQPAEPASLAQPVRQSAASDAPTHNPNAPENKEKKSWIEIELVDEEGNPVPGESYRITLPDGTTVADGTLDEKGFARVDNIDPGTCKVTFPNLDLEAWEPK